ncbi:MAG: hypothetical protein MJ033_00770 [Victivallaceae bacterium]|nr:hypothetical protein [Victivallaceae bacterium]
MKKRFLLAFPAVAAAFALNAAEIVVEAENFKTPGDWQVVDYGGATAMMGGKAKSVATTTFDATPGDYYVFVRVMTHGGGWRYTNFTVNGLKMGRAGDEKIPDGGKPGWHWVPFKYKVHLNEKNNSIKMTANVEIARVDRILFSTDRNFDCSKAPAPVVNKDRKPSARQLEGIFGRPQPKGDGPDMLLLSGGRPWVANQHSGDFAQAGYRVTLLNGVYLDGCSGASIKITPTDPVEPTPLDGITPEFKNLAKYKIIVFDSMPTAGQEKLFTAERIATLQNYIENGGCVVFTVNVPEKLNHLLPVEKLPVADTMEEVSLDNVFALRPADQQFSLLPEKWEIYTVFRSCQAKKGSRVLSYIVDGTGSPVSPYIAEMPFGKGKVVFWNAQFERLQKAQQLFNWAYTPTLCAAIAETAYPDAKVDAQRRLKKVLADKGFQPKTIEKADIAVAIPEFNLGKTATTVTVNGNELLFSNGAKIVVANDKKSVSLYYPGAKKPYVRDLELPKVGYPAKADKVDSMETAEGVDVKREVKASKAVWTIAGIAGGNQAMITVNADDGSSYDWTFVTGEMDIDGRKFTGFGQQVTLTKMPSHLLASISLVQKVDVGNKNFRRFTCYQPPRGYKDFDFSGKIDNNTRNWGFFSDGQPFSWIEGSDAVFAEFVDAPAPTGLGYTVKKGNDYATGRINFEFGRVKAPQQTPLFWQMVTDAKYNTTNDWIAMYQYMRKNLRQKVNFPETAAKPCSAHSNTCTRLQIAKIMDFARDHGFDLHFLPYCPTPMEGFQGKLSMMQMCKERDLAGYPWFPCCHSPDVTPTVKEHPEWYHKDENGKLATYFGHFYTADMNHPEFMKWHLGVVDNIMAQGVKTVWYDMGGTASHCVNFGTPESRVNFWSQMEIFRHYFKNGGWVVTEGQNPCVIDGYIFRENIYNEPVGNEFAMIGAQIHWGGFRCPFFRLAMYDIFWPMELDALALDFETGIGRKAKLASAVAFVPAINETLAFGMPFIRETPCGTSWISDKGGALFFWDGVKELKAELPAGFVADYLVCNGKKVVLNGKMPASVEAETIVVFRKK